MNLGHFVDQNARRLAGRPAFVWGDRVWNWAEFDARVRGMAAALVHEGGIVKGDRVLVQSQNCNQLLESMFACFRIGAIWVPANFRGTPDDLNWMAELSGAKALICNAEFPDHAQIKAPLIKARFAIGKADFGPDIDDLINSHRDTEVPLAAVDRDDPAWFFFTSGTTGRTPRHQC